MKNESHSKKFKSPGALALGICVFMSLGLGAWLYVFPPAVVVEIKMCGEGECKEPFLARQILGRKWERFDLAPNSSIFVDLSDKKSWAVFWKEKRVRLMEQDPFKDTSQWELVSREPFNDCEFSPCEKWVFRSADRSSDQTADQTSSQAKAELLTSTSVPYSERLLKSQNSEASGFIAMIAEQNPKAVIVEVKSFGLTGPLSQILQTTKVSARYAGLFKDDPDLLWPKNFLLQSTKSLQELPPEVRESILKGEKVQILEAKPK